MDTSTLPITPLHVRANRLDLLARIAQDLAHEIRNPLHAVAINIELARRRALVGPGDTVLERLDIVEREIGRAHAWTDALLRLLCPAADSPAAPFPATLEELHGLIQVQARLARASLAWNVPAEDDADQAVRAAIRPLSLQHAVLNLVTNALDAVEPAGRLHIDADVSPHEVSIRVGDSGPGLSDDAVAHYGVPGYTTRPGHAGLGVAVARSLVEEAGGRIELDDTGAAGLGAAVRIIVPRADPA